MGQVSAKLRASHGGFSHWCPGCNEAHHIAVDPPLANGARWQFDGNLVAPTFSPSVRISSGHYVDGQAGKECWCTYEARLGEPAPFHCSRCHYFIRAGRIEYCADSTHALAGQTVPLPDLPDHMRDVAGG